MWDDSIYLKDPFRSKESLDLMPIKVCSGLTSHNFGGEDSRLGLHASLYISAQTPIEVAGKRFGIVALIDVPSLLVSARNVAIFCVLFLTVKSKHLEKLRTVTHMLQNDGVFRCGLHFLFVKLNVSPRELSTFHNFYKQVIDLI